MAKQFLDMIGLEYFWNKIKVLLNNKSDNGHTHSASEVSGLSDVAKDGRYESLVDAPILAAVATSGSYNDLSNKPTILSRATNGFDGAICAGADGVAEYGRYCDFHFTKSTTSDYSTRLECTGDYKNNVNLPSGAGTLVIGDKAYKVVTASSAPTTNDTSVITLVV